MTARLPRSTFHERLKHVLWAAAIAFALLLSTMLEPFDQLTWATQARVSDRQMSGDIVFVSSEDDIADSQFPERREELTRALQALRLAGVHKVFVDTVFSRPSRAGADANLNREMQRWGKNLVLISRYTDRVTGRKTVAQSTPAVSQGIASLASSRKISILNFVWALDSQVEGKATKGESLPSAIAGVPHEPGTDKIFYGFDLDSLPTISIGKVVALGSANRAALRSDLLGKTVIIGSTNFKADPPFRIPGRLDVPGPVIHVLAAETLKAGIGKEIDPRLLLAMMTLLLLAAACLPERKPRRWLYSSLVVALAATVAISTWLETYISLSGTLVMLALYGALRIRAYWQRSVRLVDEQTGLPTFAALDADATVAATGPAIIVARIHRFEEVRRTLPVELHAEYVNRIVERLRAARPDEKIYTGSGHLIAWTMAEKDPQAIRDHLDGMRALFSSPLQVGGTQVDVGITFGVDVGSGPNVARRVANAVSAAETTNEAYDPVNIAENDPEEDLLWNISLQARIDKALESGEIYLIFQPKVLLATREMVGVEALVRWNDPQRGQISPETFIKQCENAGRMSHLTRHVLREACTTGNTFCERGMQVPVAVNISATLLHEYAIVDMVRQVLDETGFEPRHLTLEVTETYRLSSMDRAATILGALRALGCRIAMDDFGVGAASLEALMCLPFDELKVDRIFTSAIVHDSKAAAIVRHVLKLGRDMGIVVVAEGAENAGTLSILSKEGCLVAQGFALSRPVYASSLMASNWFRPVETQRNMV